MTLLSLSALPATQLVQEALAVVEEYFPDSQTEQAVEPALENFPTIQFSQLAPEEEKYPGGQPLQVFDW